MTFVPSMRASFFWAVFESVIPTQRGDHIFEMNYQEVICCDAEMLIFHLKTQQIRALRNTDQNAGCV